jgi:uncharacterized protein GlcG (DUF336 family)
MSLGDRAFLVRPGLSAAQARRMVDDAVTQAAALMVSVSVAVVDGSGVIKEFTRMDGAPLVSIESAVHKAYAAAATGMPSDEFFAAVESDPAALAWFAHGRGLALVAGGLPLVVDGEIAGGGRRGRGHDRSRGPPHRGGCRQRSRCLEGVGKTGHRVRPRSG